MMNAYMGLARFYDDLTGDVPYESFADYYENKFRERGKTVHTLLDFACGTGTLTCIMARRGYEFRQHFRSVFLRRSRRTD